MTEEEAEIAQELNECLEKLRKVKAMPYWGYTREHNLGKVEVAEQTIQTAVNDLC